MNGDLRVACFACACVCVCVCQCPPATRAHCARMNTNLPQSPWCAQHLCKQTAQVTIAFNELARQVRCMHLALLVRLLHTCSVAQIAHLGSLCIVPVNVLHSQCDMVKNALRPHLQVHTGTPSFFGTRKVLSHCGACDLVTLVLVALRASLQLGCNDLAVKVADGGCGVETAIAVRCWSPWSCNGGGECNLPPEVVHGGGLCGGCVT